MSNILNCTGYELIDDTIVAASGCFVINKTGKRYLDADSGVWCTILVNSSFYLCSLWVKGRQNYKYCLPSSRSPKSHNSRLELYLSRISFVVIKVSRTSSSECPNCAGVTGIPCFCMNCFTCS